MNFSMHLMINRYNFYIVGHFTLTLSLVFLSRNIIVCSTVFTIKDALMTIWPPCPLALVKRSVTAPEHLTSHMHLTSE